MGLAVLPQRAVVVPCCNSGRKGVTPVTPAAASRRQLRSPQTARAGPLAAVQRAWDGASQIGKGSLIAGGAAAMLFAAVPSGASETSAGNAGGRTAPRGGICLRFTSQLCAAELPLQRRHSYARSQHPQQLSNSILSSLHLRNGLFIAPSNSSEAGCCSLCLGAPPW